MLGTLENIKRWVLSTFRDTIVQHHRRTGSVLFSDTTLRDGVQMPGASLEPEDKVQLAKAIEEVGVHSMDAGFPASSQADIDAIQLMSPVVKRAILTALCRTVPEDIDAASEALAGRSQHKRGVSLFCGVSPLHRRHKFGLDKAGVLNTITESISYAAEKFLVVAFSPEDASRTERDFLTEIYREAISAGATTIGFPDTVGVLNPEKARSFIRHIQDTVPNIDQALLAVHCHNDLGLATANTLACVEEGANIVQCTVNGLGERAGNAAMEEVAMGLSMHFDQYRRRSRIDTTKLFPLCQLAANLTGVPISLDKPVCGENIFASEAGIHQSALLKNPDTLLAVCARARRSIGNQNRPGKT